MIDVLMLTYMDHANTGWRTMKCLQSLGLEVVFLKGHYHPFMYPEQGCVHPSLLEAFNGQKMFPPPRVPELKRIADNAKILHFIASAFVDTGTNLKQKKVVMQHGGATYRVNHETINNNLNPYISASAVQMPDLMGLGAKNEHLIFFSVDTDYLKPEYQRHSDSIIIGHFPSASAYKGTSDFLEVISSFKEGSFEYMGCDGETMQLYIWLDVLKAMRQCDVILDVLAPKAQGRTYGEWGNIAFEAAALGKIVITNSSNIEMYKREYGCVPAMRIANSKGEVERHLREIISMTPEQMLNERKAAREWVEENHSIKATANRYWEKIYKYFV
jgi:glycosyltransferase involved in cell wall biosynthesis